MTGNPEKPDNERLFEAFTTHLGPCFGHLHVGAAAFPLSDLRVIQIRSAAEECLSGKHPPARGPIRSLLARLKHRCGHRWIWRVYGTDKPSVTRWIYVLQAKSSSWRNQFAPVIDRILESTKDIGVVVCEEVPSGGSEALAQIGTEVTARPASNCRFIKGSAWDESNTDALENAAGLQLPWNRIIAPLIANVRQAGWSLRRWLSLLAGMMAQRPPGMVLVCNDLESVRRGACRLAQSMRIPVVNIQHGMINEGLSYRLGISDRHLLWGERFKSMLMRLGIASETLTVVGAPQYDRLAGCGSDPTDRTDARPVVLYAAQTPGFELSLDNCLHLLDLHDRLAAELSYADVVIRPHPRTPAAVMARARELASARSNLRICSEGDVASALKKSDLVTTVFSTVSIDAAAHGRPTLILDCAGEGHRFPLERKPPFFAVKQDSDLAPLARETLEYCRTPQAADDCREFCSDVLAGLDGRATARAADTIVDILENACQA